MHNLIESLILMTQPRWGLRLHFCGLIPSSNASDESELVLRLEWIPRIRVPRWRRLVRIAAVTLWRRLLREVAALLQVPPVTPVTIRPVDSQP